jgi:hypothetical protein
MHIPVWFVPLDPRVEHISFHPTLIIRRRSKEKWLDLEQETMALSHPDVLKTGLLTCLLLLTT